jgi:hypothetical protein
MGVDWNEDGSVDEGDAWIELYNRGDSVAHIGKWALDDGVEDTAPYEIPGGTVIEPHGFIVFYRDETGIALGSESGAVHLLDEEGGRIVDAVTYEGLDPGAGYSLGEDSEWHADWPPSPGMPNNPPGAERGPAIWPDCSPSRDRVCAL